MEGEEDGRPATWIRPPQIDRLRDACYDDAFQPALHQRNEAIVVLLYDAGLSVGELVRVDVDHLDLDAGTLAVPTDDADGAGGPDGTRGDEVTDDGASGDATSGDGRGSVTTVPLDPDGSLGTVRLLKSYLYNRSKDATALFPSRKSARLTPKAVRDAVRKVARAAEVRPCTPDGRADHDALSPHTLRHGAAWRILNAEDGDMDDVRARLRHASVRTTERIYGHFVPRREEPEGTPLDVTAASLLDSIPAGFVTLDDQWRITYVNEAVLWYFDRRKADLIGRPLFRVFPKLEGTDLAERLREVARTGDSVSFETRYEPIDEWIDVRVAPFEDGLSVYVASATDRRQREHELERYETIIETVSDGIYTLDEELNFDTVNDAMVSMTGYSREELLGEDGSLLATDEEMARGAKVRAETIAAGGDSFTMDGEMHTADGDVVPIESRISLLPGGGEFGGSIGVVRDVTEHRRREQELERYETIVETVDDGVYTLGADMSFETANDALVSMSGYSREELLGADLSLIVDDETRSFVGDLCDAMWDEGLGMATLDITVLTADGEEVPAEVRFSVLPSDEGFRGTVGVVRDVTERQRRERELREEQAFTEGVLDTIPDTFYAVGTDLSFLRWNDQLPAVSGYSDDEIAEMHPSRFVPEEDWDRFDDVITSILEDGRTETIESTLRTRDGEEIDYEYNGSPITDGKGNVVGLAGTARDITEQKAYERTLAALHESTRELIQAKTKKEVCRTLVETATDVLNLSGVATHLYDPDDDLLHPVAQDFTAAEIVPPRDLPATDTSLVGHTFVTGETAVYDDVNESDRLRRPSTNLRSGLFIPLGDHGTFLAGSTEPGVFDEQTIELADIFAASAEAALDRVVREEELRDRGETLARQRDELETLGGINVLMQEVRRAMLQASTREEIERTICERLADSEFYEFAWVTERELTGANAVPRVSMGIDEDRAREMAALYREIDAEPLGAQALREGELQVVSTVHDEEWFAEPTLEFARRHDYHSTLAVPLTHGSTTYGVLGVVSSSPHAFSEREQAAFTTLGETIAFAISAVQNRQLLLTDSTVELEFRGETDREFVVDLSRRLDCTCVLEGTVPANGGHLLHYVTIRDVPTDRIRETLVASEQVADFRVVEESATSCLVEVNFQDSLPKLLTRTGARVRSARASGGEVHVVAEIAPDADIRGLADAVAAAYPGVSLSSKQTVDRPIETAKEFREDIADQLTDKQRTSLRAAYHAGYYDWPRGSTAEEIAQSMGVSSPTLHHHLRRSHRKLLQSIFDDGVS